MTNNILFLLLKKKNTITISFLLFLFTIFALLLVFSFSMPVNGKNSSIRSINNIILKINSRITVDINEITKSIISLNGPVDIKGRVDGNVISVGKSVYVQGVVENNVIVLGGDIILTEGSAIRKNAVTFGGNILQSHGAMIGGKGQEINFLSHWNFSGFLKSFSYLIQYPKFYFNFPLPVNFLLFRIIFIMAITALIVVLLPKQIISVANAIQQQLWKNLIIAFLAVISIFPFALFLGVTIVGITVIPLIMLLFMLAGFIGGIAVNYIVGYHMLGVFNLENPAMIWCVFSGLIILELLKTIPLSAIIVSPFFYLLGLGSVIYTIFGTR